MCRAGWVFTIDSGDAGAVCTLTAGYNLYTEPRVAELFPLSHVVAVLAGEHRGANTERFLQLRASYAHLLHHAYIQRDAHPVEA